MQVPPDIQKLEDELGAIDADAVRLADGLSEPLGVWRAAPGTWGVAECLDHLATANRVYLAAMTPAAQRAKARGRVRRRPAIPGLIGGWFARSLEPPPKTASRLKAPSKIRPRPSPTLADALAAFTASQRDVRQFLRSYADLDLAGVTFPNPFIPGLRFSLATGLHVITAHDRRHLWQAWRARRAAEGHGTQK